MFLNGTPRNCPNLLEAWIFYKFDIKISNTFETCNPNSIVKISFIYFLDSYNLGELYIRHMMDATIIMNAHTIKHVPLASPFHVYSHNL